MFKCQRKYPERERLNKQGRERIINGVRFPERCEGIRYNAQWKETGKFEQCYVATPMEGYHFSFWMSESRERLSEQQTWVDTYGSSRIIQAVFEKD